MGLVLKLQKISTILIIFILFSCANTIPEVKLDNINVKQKLDFKVALIMSDKINNYVHLTTVNGKCKESSNSGNSYVKTGSFYAKNKVGKSAEEIIIKGLPYLFNNVDVYKSLSEVKNQAMYDFIVLPEILAETSYDKDQVAKRKEIGTFPSIRDFRGWKERTCFDISAKIELNLKIINAKNGVLIGNFRSPFTGLGNSCFGTCSNNSANFDMSVTDEYSKAFSLAINNAFPRLLQAIEIEMQPLAKAKTEERALPSSLALIPRFNDTKSFLPNTTLDAGEDAEILITVKNDGKGSGYGTVLKLSSDNPKVVIDKEIVLGDIPPGETKEIKVPLKAALDLIDGDLPLQITCSEKRGYDCKKYTLSVQTARLEKPELVITGYKINDGNTGLASGNGNGIPENGETIEVIPLVKNNGAGTAINVAISIASINKDIDIKTKNATIPQITPGQTATGSLSFTLPATFSDRNIDINLTATDIRGVAASGTARQYAINTEINKPVLAYTYRIIDQKGNTRNDIQNGEEAEIEIKPINKGQLEARGISIELGSGTANFTKTRDEISRIGAQTEYTPIRFPFQIPRTTEKTSADITVKLSQRDFAGISDTINIPLRLVRPDFKVTYQILDQNQNGTLEQGESGDLIVRVENIGKLDAENVLLNLNIDRKGIFITGSKEISIGRIEAGKISEPKRYTVNVQRITEAGHVPLNFTVTEKNFGTKNIALALNIAKEQEEVITVKGQERPKQTMPSAPVYANQPPIIVIASPSDNERVASESITLRGVASGDKGISSIEVMINGKKIDIAARGVKVRHKETAEQKKKEFTFDNIPLQAGQNTITVTAYDNQNLSTTENVTVYRESKRGEIYAAVIGINQYKDSKLNLKYARNDAEAFASYLRTNLGLDNDHLFELYDENATKTKISSLLGNQLARKVKTEDTVYIFFAGHGAPEYDSSSMDRDKIRKYILTHNVELDDLYTTAISMDTVAEIFGRIQAERIIFIIDSCYSGGSGGRTILAHNSGRAVLSDEFLSRIAQGRGRIILTSSRENEVSQESDKLKHGFFTYYLLEGLKGKADTDGNGVIDLDEISLYLNRHVPAATENAQHPVKKGESEGTVVVGRVK